MTVKVLFVCLGNICRSPTAHGVFESMVEHNGFNGQIITDSAGTAAWHVGNPPDTRSTAVAAKRGFDLSHLRARKVASADFDIFDYVLAMDNQNLTDLRQLAPVGYEGCLDLFLNFSEKSESDVPDPYYGGDQGFEHVLDLVEDASRGLLEDIKMRHGVIPK